MCHFVFIIATFVRLFLSFVTASRLWARSKCPHAASRRPRGRSFGPSQIVLDSVDATGKVGGVTWRFSQPHACAAFEASGHKHDARRFEGHFNSQKIVMRRRATAFLEVADCRKAEMAFDCELFLRPLYEAASSAGLGGCNHRRFIAGPGILSITDEKR